MQNELVWSLIHSKLLEFFKTKSLHERHLINTLGFLHLNTCEK